MEDLVPVPSVGESLVRRHSDLRGFTLADLYQITSTSNKKLANIHRRSGGSYKIADVVNFEIEVKARPVQVVFNRPAFHISFLTPALNLNESGMSLKEFLHLTQNLNKNCSLCLPRSAQLAYVMNIFETNKRFILGDFHDVAIFDDLLLQVNKK